MKRSTFSSMVIGMILAAGLPASAQAQSQVDGAVKAPPSRMEAGRFEIGDPSLIHLRELDCPLPASWQFRIYCPGPEDRPTKFRLNAGICQGPTFSVDKLTKTDSAPMPFRAGHAVLSVTIRKDKQDRCRCYAYVTEPKFFEHAAVAMPADVNVKVLTDVRAKYFETGRRIQTKGSRHSPVKTIKPGESIPLILLKSGSLKNEDLLNSAPHSFPAVWLDYY